MSYLYFIVLYIVLVDLQCYITQKEQNKKSVRMNINAELGITKESHFLHLNSIFFGHTLQQSTTDVNAGTDEI